MISLNGNRYLGVSGRFLSAGLLAVTLLVLPTRASAAILTYQLNSSSFGGALDQHDIYSWDIQNIPSQIPNGQVVTGATITFANIANWNNSANELFIHLFDTAMNTGLAMQQKEDSSLTVDTLTDHITGGSTCSSNPSSCNYTFQYENANQTFSNHTSTLFANGDGNILLASPQNFTTTPTTYSYSFASAQILTLRNYMTSGGDIAIGLDPDCHYFMDSITLTLTTGPLATVPEPASLTLMGIGLAGWYRRRRMQIARA